MRNLLLVFISFLHLCFAIEASGKRDDNPLASCDLKAAFAVPALSALPTKNTSCTKVYVYGSNTQLQTSNISNFTINWSLEYKGLWQFSINTLNGVPSYWIDLLPKAKQTFYNANPDITLSNTGVAGLDGSYYVNSYGSDFVMVEKTGLYAILFSNASTSPIVCTSSVAVTGVSLDKSSLSIKRSTTGNLIATVLPSNASNKSVTWSTDNASVATVSNGTVSGVSVGTATITLTTADGGFTAKATVTVTDDVIIVPVTGVTLDKSYVKLEKGQTTLLTNTIQPSNATNKNVSWSSSNSSVATVNNGVITAVSKGTAAVIVTTADGNYTAQCSVEVTETTSTSCNLSDMFKVPASNPLPTANKSYSKVYLYGNPPSNLSLKNVNNFSINWSLEYKGLWQFSLNTTDNNPAYYVDLLPKLQQTFASASPSITISGSGVAGFDGQYYVSFYGSDFVLVATSGTYAILFSTQSTAPVVCTVTSIAVTGISLNKSSTTIDKGASETLIATVQPSNASNKSVQWSSDNTAVATVTNGVVSAVDYGTATITTKTSDGGFTATCLVTVQKVAVTGIIVSPPSVTLGPSQTAQLTASVIPSNAGNKNVTWSSSNINIATVSSSGLVTAKSVGAVVISVTTAEGNFTAICNVIVSEASADVREGMATHFDGFGNPYGGCGVPEGLLETQDFVALNVFNTPGVYIQFVRPLTGADTAKMGEFANGRNCGRWVEVTIEDNCNGINDGHPGEPFCRNGTGWYSDKYNNSKLYFIVADACGDGNAWCRDSRYHLDLSTDVLNDFKNADGSSVNDMYPLNFNNRKIQWHYVEAPNYSGDINIFFMQDAEPVWPAIVITNLKNGIHGVEQKVGSNWVKLKMNSDLGQSFILSDLNQPYTIRVYDAADKLINNGRQYTFSFPGSCGQSCATTTAASYTTFNPSGARISSDENSDVAVFPNPTNGSVTIVADEFSHDRFEVSLIDMEGKIRLSKTVEKERSYVLNIKQVVTAGVYILRLQSKDRVIFKKLAVE